MKSFSLLNKSFSKILLKIDRVEIGLKFDKLSCAPALKIGTTLATLKTSGYSPV